MLEIVSHQKFDCPFAQKQIIHLIESCSSMIRKTLDNEEKLYKLISVISTPEKKNELALEYYHLFSSEKMLISILKKLDNKSGLKLIKKCQEKITFGKESHKILKYLPKDQRLYFALHSQYERSNLPKIERTCQKMGKKMKTNEKLILHDTFQSHVIN